MKYLDFVTGFENRWANEFIRKLKTNSTLTD